MREIWRIGLHNLSYQPPGKTPCTMKRLHIYLLLLLISSACFGNKEAKETLVEVIEKLDEEEHNSGHIISTEEKKEHQTSHSGTKNEQEHKDPPPSGGGSGGGSGDGGGSGGGSGGPNPPLGIKEALLNAINENNPDKFLSLLASSDKSTMKSIAGSLSDVQIETLLTTDTVEKVLNKKLKDVLNGKTSSRAVKDLIEQVVAQASDELKKVVFISIAKVDNGNKDTLGRSVLEALINDGTIDNDTMNCALASAKKVGTRILLQEKLKINKIIDGIKCRKTAENLNSFNQLIKKYKKAPQKAQKDTAGKVLDSVFLHGYETKLTNAEEVKKNAEGWIKENEAAKKKAAEQKAKEEAERIAKEEAKKKVKEKAEKVKNTLSGYLKSQEKLMKNFWADTTCFMQSKSSFEALTSTTRSEMEKAHAAMTKSVEKLKELQQGRENIKEEFQEKKSLQELQDLEKELVRIEKDTNDLIKYVVRKEIKRTILLGKDIVDSSVSFKKGIKHDLPLSYMYAKLSEWDSCEAKAELKSVKYVYVEARNKLLNFMKQNTALERITTDWLKKCGHSQGINGHTKDIYRPIAKNFRKKYEAEVERLCGPALVE